MSPMSQAFTNVLKIAVVGAAVATLGDANHVHTGTLSYPNAFWFGQAVWVFPSFFTVFLGMAILYQGLDALLPDALAREESTAPGRPAAFIETLTLFAMVYLLSGFGNREPALLALIFYGTFLLRLALTYDRAFLMVLAVLMAIGGMLGEGAMTMIDLVHYRDPEIVGVPFWLGGLYTHGAFALREGMRFYVYGDRYL